MGGAALEVGLADERVGRAAGGVGLADERVGGAAGMEDVE